MKVKSNCNPSLPEPTGFVNHREVDWSRVRRTLYTMYQHFRYEYPGPIRELKQNLVVVPADNYGDQHVRDYHVNVSAPLSAARHEYDEFGNRIFRLNVPEVNATIDFEVWTEVERDPQLGQKPRLSAVQASRYLTSTRLTQPDDKLVEVANELRLQGGEPAALANRINEWVSQCIKYGSDVTNVSTTAAEALQLGTGLCQDYAHIMLSVCRAAGLPARYVSGHLLGEGGSHAWVEVLLPDPHNHDFVAWAFDPTNHCQAGYNYITVAVGRDFRDVSPTSGSYIGNYMGRLISSKRAGLVAVEFVDGETRLAS